MHSEPGEGKSTICLILSTQFSSAGNKTVFVSAEMGSKKLGSWFERYPQLSNTQFIDWDQALVILGEENISICLNFLGDQIMQEFSEFDFVIIDSWSVLVQKTHLFIQNYDSKISARKIEI